MIAIAALLLPISGSVLAETCLKNGGRPEEIKLHATQLLRSRKIDFREEAGGTLRIVPAATGQELNLYAERVRTKYGARVVIAPADLVCGAAAETDPGDVCDLAVNLGHQALSDDSAGTTLAHEEKHLELAAPRTNGGFDSLFFGRISNLDATDKSFYSTFALDEIAAYAAELTAPGNTAATRASAETQAKTLLGRAVDVIDRYLAVLDQFGRAKGYSAVEAEGGGVAIANVEREDSPAVIFSRIDWRNSGPVNTVVLVDGRDQVTLPLFSSRLDVHKTRGLVGAGAPWPVAPLLAEINALRDRLRVMSSTFKRMKRELEGEARAQNLAATARSAERYAPLKNQPDACPKPRAPAPAMISPPGAAR